MSGDCIELTVVTLVHGCVHSVCGLTYIIHMCCIVNVHVHNLRSLALAAVTYVHKRCALNICECQSFT